MKIWPRTACMVNFFLEVKDVTCYSVAKDKGMDLNSILIENARARRPLPANLQIGKSAGTGSDEGRDNRKKQVVPFIPFDRDSVDISLENSSRTEIRQDLLQFHVSLTRNRVEIEEKGRETGKKVSSDIAAYKAEGVAITDSKIVQEERSIGPYGLHVNQSAMRRYEQAGSYRNWHPTTFEITV